MGTAREYVEHLERCSAIRFTKHEQIPEILEAFNAVSYSVDVPEYDEKRPQRITLTLKPRGYMMEKFGAEVTIGEGDFIKMDPFTFSLAAEVVGAQEFMTKWDQVERTSK